MNPIPLLIILYIHSYFTALQKKMIDIIRRRKFQNSAGYLAGVSSELYNDFSLKILTSTNFSYERFV